MNNKFSKWKEVEAEVTIRKNEETVSILTGIFSLHENNTLCTLINNRTKEHLTFIRKSVEEEKHNLKVKLIDGRELIVIKRSRY